MIDFTHHDLIQVNRKYIQVQFKKWKNSFFHDRIKICVLNFYIVIHSLKFVLIEF